jgi:hypothetical protein
MTAQAAAELLGTSPTVLSLWQRRFGYPVPVRSDDGEWLYPDDAMIALRDALGRELSIPSAITKARQAQAMTFARSLDLSRPQTPEEAR